MSAALVFEVGAHGAFLATRSKGKTVREDLKKSIRNLNTNDEIVVNFTGVDAMTITFADEFIGKFYTSVAAGDISVSVVLLGGLNDETLEAVAVCLERRDLLAAATVDANVELVAAPEFLEETYRCAATLETFKASDLSERLGTTSSNMNNRLKRLTAGGALHRVRSNTPNRGGKEFIYSVPRPGYC